MHSIAVLTDAHPSDAPVGRYVRVPVEVHEADLTEWNGLVDRVEAATKPVRVGIIGKYVSLIDAYLSVAEAIRHAGYHHGAEVEIEWIQAEEVEGLLASGRLAHLDGIVIPGGFGERGTEGKMAEIATAW